jgi:hypothetical protein
MFSRLLASALGSAALILSFGLGAVQLFSVTNGAICKPINTLDLNKLEFRATALKNVSSQGVWVACPVDTNFVASAPTGVVVAVTMSNNSAIQKIYTCVLREVRPNGSLAKTLWQEDVIPASSAVTIPWEVPLETPANSVAVACELPGQSQLNGVISLTLQ